MMAEYIIRWDGKPISINQVERWSGKANYTRRKKLEQQFTWLMIAAKVS